MIHLDLIGKPCLSLPNTNRKSKINEEMLNNRVKMGPKSEAYRSLHHWNPRLTNDS